MKNVNLNLVLATFFLAACFQACLWEEMPVIDTGKSFVEESREKLREDIIMGPGFDPALRDSLIKELTPILLKEAWLNSVQDWYALSSSWADRYGAEENLQLYANLVYEKFFNEGNLIDAAKVKLTQGRVHYFANRYDQAIEHSQKAYELALTAGDSITMTWALNHLVGPYFYIGNVAAARNYVTRSYELALLTGHRPVMISLDLATGTMMGSMNKVDSAIYYLEKALVSSEEMQMTEYTTAIVANMGYSFLKNGCSLEAFELLKPRIENVSSKATISNVAMVLTYGEACMKEGLLNEADKYLSRGCSMAATIDFAYGKSECSRLKSAYYSQIGDPAQALAFFKEYHIQSKAQLNETILTNAEVYKADMEVRERNRAIEKMQMIEREREEKFIMTIQIILALVALMSAIGIGSFVVSRTRSQVRIEEQKRISAEAKLNVLQAQMNPHFIYNALSGIQNFILHSKKIEAFNYLSKFAGLLRIITKSSTEVFIELEREVELLSTYLDLEKLRFRDAFDYALIVEDNLKNENLRIPSMMIQPVVENAIIHGLSKLKGGKLSIKIQREGDGILCIVTDNGRGRKAAIEIASKNKLNHLSVATVNGDERIQSLRSLGYPHAKLETDDLYDGDQACGTRVRIYLPFKQ